MRVFISWVFEVYLSRYGRQACSEADSQLLGLASSCEMAEPVLADKSYSFLIETLLVKESDLLWSEWNENIWTADRDKKGIKKETWMN